jgi:hypothetical protein
MLLIDGQQPMSDIVGQSDPPALCLFSFEAENIGKVENEKNIAQS